MDVRPHMSQHERAEALPLVTDSARVRGVDPLDDNRVDEVEDAVPGLLRRFDREEWIESVVDRHDNVDWDRLWSLVEGGVPDPGLRERVAALKERVERPYPSLVSITIDAPAEFSFVAGQYVTVNYDGVPRPYSLSCSPTESRVEICVRRVPGGRLSSRLCTELSPGDRVTLRGPNGEFVLDEPSGRDAVFLATGTGVAPLRSMIEYTFEEGRDVVDGRSRDVWLFLGAGWEDDLPYRDRFRELSRERGNFHFVPCLTREPFVTDWDGETDYVQRTMAKYVDPDAVADADADLPDDLARVAREDRKTDVEATLFPDRMAVYACGINAMVASVTAAVEALGVDPDHVDSEGYG